MQIVEIPGQADAFILHFATEQRRVNAYALATSLVGLADAIKQANAIINPGYSVEVVVERLEDGSFRATVRSITKKAANLLTGEAPKAIVYGVLSTWIYSHAIEPPQQPKPPIVIVNDNSVEIDSGGTKIIVPRNIYEASKEVERSEQFHKSMGQVFSGAMRDPDVYGLKLTPPGDWPSYPLVPRQVFAVFAYDSDISSDNVTVERVRLEISRAIMSRGRRKWEFYWRGIKIAAPVLDNHFYDVFAGHEITIAPGDMLDVELKIYRKIDPDTGIMVNVRYEVVDVIDHVPRGTQMSF
jgi:hypothetical protein